MLTSLNAEYKGDMTERYMCLKNESGEEDFRERMLVHNRIGGYLPLIINEEGGEKEYRYIISDCRSLSDIVAEKPVKAELLKFMLEEMEKIFIRGRSYMFEEDNFVLHPDAVYFSSSGELRLCYLSGYEKDIKEQICELISFMMSSVDVNDRESVYAFYSSYMLAREENCTFRSLINGLKIKDGLPEDIPGLLDKGSDAPVKNESENGIKISAVNTARKQALGYVAVAVAFTAVVLAFLFL